MRCMPFTLSALLWFQASSFDPREPASTETSTSTTTSTTTATTTTRTRTTRTTTTVTAETVSTSSTVITTSTSTTVTSTTTVKCCQYGDWADWTQCLVPCQGQQLRIRGVDMPQEQADRCQDRRELRSCAEQCMDCVWSEWGSWEACGPGGGGKVSRYRQSVPREGGIPCSGDNREERSCPRDCRYTDWSSWACARCSAAETRRSRETVPADPGGRPCTEHLTEHKLCWEAGCDVPQHLLDAYHKAAR
mmetsp:Transcript_65984/g.157551  ORF Transcript_65984/g.157551 Transcript_65984/m.157551 type:complete len:248 (+) Transcript_65984:88-831(+)